VYGFFRKMIELWLLILCWCHVKYKKCFSNWTLEWYMCHTSIVRVSVCDICWTRDTPLMRRVWAS